MKNIIFPILFYLFFTPNFLSAQDGEPRKHQISIDLFGLIKVQNVNLLYQQRFSKGSLRLGASGGFKIRNSNSDDRRFANENYNYNLALRIGWAYHQKIKEFDLYYGADLVPRVYFDQSSRFRALLSSNSFLEERTIDKYFQIGLGIAPMMGINYAINDVFSIGLEIRHGVSYVVSNTQELIERATTDLLTSNVELEMITTEPVQSQRIQAELFSFTTVWLSVHL